MAVVWETVGWLAGEREKKGKFVFIFRAPFVRLQLTGSLCTVLSLRFFDFFELCGCFGRLARLVCYSHCSFSVESMQG